MTKTACSSTAVPFRRRALSFALGLQAAWRFLAFLRITSVAGIAFFFSAVLTGRSRRVDVRARWLQSLCQRLLRLLDITPEYFGDPPESGLLVCNHLSYVDIIVLAARHPMAFVSKKEVRAWPLVGSLAAAGGTIFIDRDVRRDVVRTAGELSHTIGKGTVVCIFPEGTSSGGADVLPFRPSLLHPAVEGGWRITPAAICYSLIAGSVPDEVCYWRDMEFLPHFMNLLSRRKISARVVYGPSRPAGQDRKALAVQLETQVRALMRWTTAEISRAA